MRVNFLECVFLCLFATLGTRVAAMEVDTRAIGHCAREFDFGRALSNETLHNQVLYWAHNHDVRDWQWEKTTASQEILKRWELSTAEAAGLQCVGVRYAAAIRIPEPFESLLVIWHMSVEIPLRVQKVVCVGNRKMYEDALIEEPVLNRIKMSTKHELVTGYDLQSTAKTTLDLPWYASVLESQVYAALDRSVGEKFDAVVQSLCEPHSLQLRSVRSVRSLRSKRRGLFSGWTGLRPVSHPFAGPSLGNTTKDDNASSVHGYHKKPLRPDKPVHQNASWIVILLPEEEDWPVPENESLVENEKVEKDCEESIPCDKSVTKPSVGKVQLAVRRRMSSHTSEKTRREESAGTVPLSRGITT